MDINKVDLLLKFVLAAAGQEDDGNWGVGPIREVGVDGRRAGGRDQP